MNTSGLDEPRGQTSASRARVVHRSSGANSLDWGLFADVGPPDTAAGAMARGQTKCYGSGTSQEWVRNVPPMGLATPG